MELHEFNQVLADLDWTYTDLALLLTDLYPGERFSRHEVREAVRRWCGKTKKVSPRGKTMKVIKVCSIIAGRPLSESVEWIFNHSWQHQRKPSPPRVSRRAPNLEDAA